MIPVYRLMLGSGRIFLLRDGKPTGAWFTRIDAAREFKDALNDLEINRARGLA